MLSVQSPGCAGMERLGAPGGPGGGGGGGLDRQRQRRELDNLTQLQNMAALQQMSREMNRLLELQAQAQGAHLSDTLNCPHRIQLPDGEYGPDRHLQLRVPYQQDELTQLTVQPPPNKSVRDVPEWAAGSVAPVVPLPIRKPPSPHKKYGLMQKAVKCWENFRGGRGAEAPPDPPPDYKGSEPAPCVMVPKRPAVAPTPPTPPQPPPS